jgi:hypothetical protein
MIKTMLRKYISLLNYPMFRHVSTNRGFRQATRGSDTGAFHHPFFRRDQPHLCVQMVCQKSRDRQTTQKRSLPPKKRMISEAFASPSKEKVTPPQSPSKGMPTTPSRSVPGAAVPAPISISGDDRSISNSSLASQVSNSTIGETTVGTHPKVVSTTVSLQTSLAPATTTTTTRTTTSGGILPFVSNDSAFVASTLRQRDSQELMRAAQAMLYDAYMKALKETS